MKFLVIFLFFFASNVQGAEQKPAANFQFDRIAVIELVKIYYSEIEKIPYLVYPEVYAVDSVVGFVYTVKSKGGARVVFMDTLKAAGLKIDRVNGVDHVKKIPVVEPPAPVVPVFDVFVYKPKHRDISYFSDLLASVFKDGRFTFQKAVTGPPDLTAGPKPIDSGTSAFSLASKNFDVLVFYGPKQEIEKLENLLKKLDIAEGQVDVYAYVFEFSDTESDTSGVGVLADIISGTTSFKATLGSLASENSLSFQSSIGKGLINLVAQNLQSDDRFRVVSRPSVRVKSGSSASFISGEEVPVLGAIQTEREGGVYQSVEYKSSGVILDVNATVRQGSIDLFIDQQLSNFVPTLTGVNASPTLTKRQVKTSVSVKTGDLLVIGGLVIEKEAEGRSKFLGVIPYGKKKSSQKTEILMVLEVQVVD